MVSSKKISKILLLRYSLNEYLISKLRFNEKELDLLFNKMDIDKDQKIRFWEFSLFFSKISLTKTDYLKQEMINSNFFSYQTPIIEGKMTIKNIHVFLFI